MSLIEFTCFMNANLFIGTINIIKEEKKKSNVCLSDDNHHPLSICTSTVESIDRLLLIE
jgi:hypothetical protein